jgi:hypothetical protein
VADLPPHRDLDGTVPTRPASPGGRCGGHTGRFPCGESPAPRRTPRRRGGRFWQPVTTSIASGAPDRGRSPSTRPSIHPRIGTADSPGTRTEERRSGASVSSGRCAWGCDVQGSGSRVCSRRSGRLFSNAVERTRRESQERAKRTKGSGLAGSPGSRAGRPVPLEVGATRRRRAKRATGTQASPLTERTQ